MILRRRIYKICKQENRADDLQKPSARISLYKKGKIVNLIEWQTSFQAPQRASDCFAVTLTQFALRANRLLCGRCRIAVMFRLFKSTPKSDEGARGEGEGKRELEGKTRRERGEGGFLPFEKILQVEVKNAFVGISKVDCPPLPFPEGLSPRNRQHNNSNSAKEGYMKYSGAISSKPVTLHYKSTYKKAKSFLSQWERKVYN